MRRAFEYDGGNAELELIQVTRNGWVTVRFSWADKVWKLGWNGRRLSNNRESKALQKYSPTLKSSALSQLHRWAELDEYTHSDSVEVAPRLKNVGLKTSSGRIGG